MGISFYYQNVRGLRSKTNTCSINSHALLADFICLTETFLNDSISDKELLNSSYTVYRRDRNSTASTKRDGGGVLIAAKHGFHTVPMPSLQSGAEDLWLKVQCGQLIFLLCCVYLPPSADEALNLFLSSVSAVRDAYPEIMIVIIGDFNMPTISWSMSEDDVLIPTGNFDRRAIDFLNIYSYCNFSQFNNVSNINNRILDLVLCANGRVESIHLCNDPLVDPDCHHPPFEFLLSGMFICLSDGPNVRFLFKNANSGAIKCFLNSIDWQTVFAGMGVESMVEVFYDRVNYVINRDVPKRFLPKQRFPYWYKRSTIRVIKEKLLYHKKWKSTRHNSDYLAFSILRSRSKRLIAADYRDYLNSIQAGVMENPKGIWSFVKSRKGDVSGLPAAMFSVDQYLNQGIDS
nr:uncharacterized protein LOC111429451 [Onthophagus taurus]